MERIARSIRGRINPYLYSYMTGSTVLFNPHLSAKVLPVLGKSNRVVMYRPGAEGRGIAPDGFPVPSEDRWETYGNTPDEYLESGRQHMAAMRDILDRAGCRASALSRVLEFGCAAARMLRNFPRENDGIELWGVDVNAAHIAWCHENLPLPFRFATTTTAPHLPFEDGTFDLIFAGSVFTHITDLADAWLLELRRVCRSGGYLYVTVHDESTVRLLNTSYAGVAKLDGMRAIVNDVVAAAQREGRDWTYFSYSVDPDSGVYYRSDYLAERWSRYAEIVSITPEAYGYQTAVLLRKR